MSNMFFNNGYWYLIHDDKYLKSQDAKKFVQIPMDEFHKSLTKKLEEEEYFFSGAYRKQRKLSFIERLKEFFLK